MKNSQALLHFCSKTFHYSKPASKLQCDHLSNQSYQTLVTSTIFLQIHFFLQIEAPNTHTHSPNPILAPNWESQHMKKKKKQ